MKFSIYLNRRVFIMYKMGCGVIRIIATDKRGIHIIFFLFLDENICCGYSLEAPRFSYFLTKTASNEYPQHMFLSRNKKDISIFG